MKKLFLILIIAFTTAPSLLAQHFVGMDMSMLPKYEEHNKPYLDKDNKPIQDMLQWLPSIGVNTVRVRLFVNPNKKNPKGERDIAVCQDLDYVSSFGARIKAAGLNFMLDLHYSDTWADPSYQKLPAAWSDCKTADEKAARVYSYTTEVLQTLNASGATPDFVQVGNEITYGMIGISVHPYDYNGDNWAGFAKVIGEGCKAVREQCQNAKILIHTERSGNASQTSYYYKKLASLDYDIIGLSYYPFWHGKLSDLENTLTTLAKDFPDKPVQIVETAYNFQYSPDGVKYDTKNIWPYNEAGQKKFLDDLIASLNKFNNVNGLYYWFPEEAGNGDDSNWGAGGQGATVIDGWCNRGLWKSEVSGNGHKCNSGLYSLQGYATSIENVEQDEFSTPMFNLSGQKIDEAKKGEPYISNGKKIICK